ncbi:MAG: AAA family ATPase [Planctomycetes bacterium]|nr:AAA family ATPase [Planctomycetota bacterium]MBU1517769.1 AAA family ATPase [Planctomycetota bacterium]MBU2458376.1 AAA family ATPase [Planctomycetota bacterium]MBU2596593.1 AAA family ATPase [Planctomycetota bacterium]
MITTLSANKKFDWNLPLTDKAADVLRAFGITVQRLKNNAITHSCEIELSGGDICYITGPSGSGKSVLLREFFSNFDNDRKINIDDIPLPDDKTTIDCVQGGFLETLRTLSNAGLTDVFCVLNSPATLSEGQKYRYRIAKALASDKQFIFADEFCSNLDRVTAAVISHNLRKFAAKTGKVFILASSHDDLLADLLPEVIVIKHLAGESEVVYKNQR